MQRKTNGASWATRLCWNPTAKWEEKEGSGTAKWDQKTHLETTSAKAKRGNIGTDGPLIKMGLTTTCKQCLLREGLECLLQDSVQVLFFSSLLSDTIPQKILCLHCLQQVETEACPGKRNGEFRAPEQCWGEWGCKQWTVKEEFETEDSATENNQA